MSNDPHNPEPEMTKAERVLLEHRAAVRVNLATDPGDLGHAARTLHHAIDTATYACVATPPEVLAAAAVVDRWATCVRAQVAAEQAQRERTGQDQASFQRALERAQVHQPPSVQAPAPLWVGGPGPGQRHNADREQERGWGR
jgi:hypothetical protein